MSRGNLEWILDRIRRQAPKVLARLEGISPEAANVLRKIRNHQSTRTLNPRQKMSIPETRIVDGFRFAVVPAVPGTFCNTAVRMLPSETQPEQALRRQAAENREHAAALLEEAKLLEKALEP